MQTKHDVARLLASAGVGPNKRLGQNFLIDLNLMRLLVDSAGIERDDVVLEVGCGTGSLTEGLAEKAGKVVCVEYDKTLAPIARRQVEGLGDVEIINADALENKNTFCLAAAEVVCEARERLGGRVLLVANLPYNVAAAVMANLIVGPLVVDAMYVTVQREVAERMAAGAGDKRYGVLSIVMAAAGVAKIFHKLPASVFWPRPQVESAMVKFVRDEEKLARIKDAGVFRDVVSLFMGHRRKMVKGCVKFAEGSLAEVEDWGEIFDKANIDATKRPEQLSCEDYIAIANSV
jgi:16S rRNA (adenine1518-N6/adenine1519-N6)-dimethyltransferase